MEMILRIRVLHFTREVIWCHLTTGLFKFVLYLLIIDSQGKGLYPSLCSLPRVCSKEYAGGS